MENKRFLPFRIIHILLTLATLVFCIVAIVKDAADKSYSATSLTEWTFHLLIVALIISLIYTLVGYRKQGSLYYKLFMWTFLAASVIQVANIFSLVALPLRYTFPYSISIVLIAILAVSKDFGKKASYITFICLLLCRAFILVLDLRTTSNLGIAALGILGGDLMNIMLALTASFMVVGKYLDKTERGTT